MSPDRQQRSTSLDVTTLLTIDFDAELARVTEAGLEGPWQVPAELVRRALADGARRVDVRIDRTSIEVTDDGAGLPLQALEHLAILFDASAPPAQRHRSLLALEARPGLPSLVGLRPSRVSIESRGERTQRLLLPGGRPSTAEPAGSPGTTLRIETNGFDAERARRLLASATRFTRVTVTIDARPVRRGFEDVLAEAALSGPLPGRLALPRTGDTAVAWLLLDGLVTASASLPGVPVFEAAVEMRGLVQPTDGAGALRDAAAPHLPWLTEQAAELALAAATDLRRRTAEDQRRLRGLLLTAAQRGVRDEAVARLPLLPALVPGGERWIRLDELRDSLARDARGVATLPALYPTQDAGEFVLSGEPVLVLDGDERAQLTALLGVRFRPPQSRRRPARGGRRWRRTLADALASIVHRPLRRVLRESMLLPRERSLLDALRRLVPEGVGFCSGSGPVRQARRSKLKLLPRDNSLVRDCARMVAEDPAWAYPAALALLDGKALPPPEARARWLDAAMTPPLPPASSQPESC